MDNDFDNDAETEAYYIPGTDEHRIDSMGYMLKCHKCKRKILVSMGLIGTVHHLGTSATCAECLEINAEFRKEHPDIANKLDVWKNAKDEISKLESLYVSNNGNGWAVFKPNPLHPHNRPFAWDGIEWSLISAVYFREKSEAESLMRKLTALLGLIDRANRKIRIKNRDMS